AQLLHGGRGGGADGGHRALQLLQPLQRPAADGADPARFGGGAGRGGRGSGGGSGHGCSWIEQDGDVVGGEGGGVACAGADGGLVVAARGEPRLEFVGQLGEAVGGEAHDERGLVRAGGACGHGAGLACGGDGVGSVCQRDLAQLRDEGTDGELLLVEADGRHGFGEVLHGVELAVAGDDADAGGVDGGVEQVG